MLLRRTNRRSQLISPRWLLVLGLWGNPNSLAAQIPVRNQVEQPKDALLIMPPLPHTAADSSYSVTVAARLRERFGHWHVHEARLIEFCEATESCDVLVPDTTAHHYARSTGADFYVIGRLGHDSTPWVELRLLETGRRGGIQHQTAMLTVQADADLPPDVFAQQVGGVLSDTLATALGAARDARRCWTDLVDRHYEDARSRAEGALRRFPNHPSAATCLSYVFAERNEPDSLIWALELAVVGDSTLHQAWERLGLEYLRRGDTARAIDARVREVRADPQDVERRVRIARMMDELGQREAAVTLVREGLSYPGNTLELRRILARMCLLYEMWECARDALAEQFALDSSLASDTTFYFQMIGLAQTLSDTAQVARWTGEAVMRVESLVGQAWERVETARQEAERSEQVLTSLRLAQAGVYVDLGDKDAALAVYHTILERDPDNVRAPLAAAQLLTDDRFFILESATPVDSHVLSAADSLLTSVARRSEDHDVLESIALTYLNVGTRLVRSRRVRATAVRWLQNAVRVDPDGTLQGRSNAMLAVAILYLLEEVDTQLRVERTCDLAQLEADLVSQGRAAIGASESEYPQIAAEVTPGLQAIEDLIPEILATLGCNHTGR